MRRLETKVMRKVGRFKMRASLYNHGGFRVGYKVRIGPASEVPWGIEDMKVYRDRGYERGGTKEVWRLAKVNWPSIGEQPLEIASLFGSLLVFLAALGKRLNECGQEALWEQHYEKQMARYAAIQRKAKT